MRRASLLLGLLVLCVSSSLSAADYLDRPVRTVQPRARVRVSVAQRLIQQRAFYRAQHRVSRMELARWQGHSALRPTATQSNRVLPVAPWYWGVAPAATTITQSHKQGVPRRND